LRTKHVIGYALLGPMLITLAVGCDARVSVSNVPPEDCVYVGRYYGSYSGDEEGNISAEIDEECDFSGTVSTPDCGTLSFNYYTQIYDSGYMTTSCTCSGEWTMNLSGWFAKSSGKYWLSGSWTRTDGKEGSWYLNMY